MTGPIHPDPLGFVTPEKRPHIDPEVVREALAGWLAGRLPGTGGAPPALSGLAVPPANGVANETLLVTAHPVAGTPVRLVVRIASPEPLFPESTLADHVAVIRLLTEVEGVPVPRLVGEEPDPAVLGAPFFVMEHVAGRIPSDRPNWSEAGWLAEARPHQRRRLWESAVTVLARIHSVDPARAAFLQCPADGVSGLEQAVTAWERYFRAAAGGRDHPVMEDGLAWLRDRLPADPPTGLAWGDCRIPNMIFRRFRCVAVLDWDMVSLAGAQSDLGWWIIQDHGATRHLDGIGTPAETVALWESVAGRPAGDLRYALVFNAFRLGAIRMRLARQLAAEGRLAPEMAGLETNNTAIQQLALLLGLAPPGPLTTTLPDVPGL